MTTPSVGNLLSLTIEKPAAGGRMIARADRLVVLVSGAIPGERVRAVVERVGKGVVYAAVRDVDEPSPDRRAHADPLCGGCLYGHVAYPRQLELKSAVVADAFQRISRIQLSAPVNVAPSPEDGYRMRARLHVRNGKVGFFREGTHDVCDARQTRQLRPDTFDALDELANAVVSGSSSSAFHDLELAENLTASNRVVHFDVVSPLGADLIDRLASIPGFTGISTPHVVRGSVHVTDAVTPRLGGPFELRRHVLAFFQGNRYLLDDLVSHVVEEVGPAREIIDLYAGVGLFSVALARSVGAKVTAVEGDRVAAADLRANAMSVGQAQLTPVHRAVEEFVSGTSARDATVVVDPPRTGLSREALGGIVAMRPRRIVYVSCDVATLARDARRFVDAGYELGPLAAFDLFPNTPHVETVTGFTRI